VVGVTFIVLGLEQADQLASVVGVLVGLAGLGVSVYGVVLARPAPPSEAPPAKVDTSVLLRNIISSQGKRSVVVTDNSGVIQTGDDSTAHK
jgi:hypothetical protein